MTDITILERDAFNIKLNTGTGSSVTMDKGTVFTTKVNNIDYQYVTNEDITITPVNGVYQFNNVKIYEGTLVTFKYTVDVKSKIIKYDFTFR